MNVTEKEKQKRIIGLPWVHTKLTHYIANKELNAVWTAVAATQDRWITFLHFVIPLGLTARIVARPVMKFKLYKADGTEQYQSADIMLAMQKVGKVTPTEICPLGYYARWYENTWLEQLNVELRESLEIDTGYNQILLWAGETLLFQVKNSGVAIPAVCHASTNLEFPIDVITDADMKRAMTGATDKQESIPSTELQKIQEEEEKQHPIQVIP